MEVYMEELYESETTEVLEGIISVKAAILAKSRRVDNVFVDLDKYKKQSNKKVQVV